MRTGRFLEKVEKAYRAVCKGLIAALVTCLYAIWSIDQAYRQRGYKAYGGEYLMVPFVFYLTLKLLLFLDRLWHRVKERKVHKEA